MKAKLPLAVEDIHYAKGHGQQPVNEQIFPFTVNSCSPRAYRDPVATTTHPSLSPICMFIT